MYVRKLSWVFYHALMKIYFCCTHIHQYNIVGYSTISTEEIAWFIPLPQHVWNIKRISRANDPLSQNQMYSSSTSANKIACVWRLSRVKLTVLTSHWQWQAVSSPGARPVTGSVLLVTETMIGENTWKCLASNTVHGTVVIEAEHAFNVRK